MNFLNSSFNKEIPFFLQKFVETATACHVLNILCEEKGKYLLTNARQNKEKANGGVLEGE